MLEKRTLRLAGLALALVAAYVGFEVLGAEPRARARRRAESLFAALPWEVEEVRLGSGTTLVRGARGLELTAPVAAAADPEAAQAFLVRLLGAKRERRLAIPAESLAVFGLDPPQAWGAVRRKGGKTVTVELGTPTPSANSVYGRIRESGETFVVWGSLLRDLGRKADDLRDRRLLHAKLPEVEGLILERPRDRIVLRRGPGGWRFEGPPGGRASAERTAALIEGILAARARVFLDTIPVAPIPPAEATERRAARIVRSVPGGGAPETLAIAIGELSAPGGLLPVAAAAQPRPVLADPELVGLLDSGADSLREDRLLPSGAEGASRVRIAVGADTLVMEREGDAWRIVRPDTLDADPVRVRALLRNLDNLRIARWAIGAEGAGALAVPRAEVAVGFEGKPLDEGFRIGAPAGDDERWAAFLGEEEPFAVPEAAASILTPDPAAFEPRAFLAPLLAGARRIRIEPRDGAGAGAVIVRRGAGWRAESGGWSDARASETAARLAGLEALDRLSLPQGGAGFIDEPGGLTVAWDGPLADTLSVGGALDPERRFARLAGRRGLYLLYAPDLESLLANTTGRSR